MNPLQPDKILSYYREAKQILAGQIPIPRMVSCWLTTVCNYNCSFCLFKEENKKDHKIVDTAKFKQFIIDIAKVGVESLEFSGGGEPTIHPDFKEITQLARMHGLKLGLFTNGTNIDKINIKMFKYIRIGLDAADAGTYNKIKKPPISKAFDIVLKHTEELLARRGKDTRPRIGFKFIVNNQNHENIRDMINIGRKIGVDYVQFKGEHNGPNVLTEEENNYCEKTILGLRFSSENTKTQILGSIKPLKSDIQCFMSPIHTVIDPKGDVFVCCYLREKNHIIGNALETPFTEFWGGDRHKRILKSLNPDTCNPYDCRFMKYNEKMKEVISDDEIDIDFI